MICGPHLAKKKAPAHFERQEESESGVSDAEVDAGGAMGAGSIIGTHNIFLAFLPPAALAHVVNCGRRCGSWVANVHVPQTHESGHYGGQQWHSPRTCYEVLEMH